MSGQISCVYSQQEMYKDRAKSCPSMTKLTTSTRSSLVLVKNTAGISPVYNTFAQLSYQNSDLSTVPTTRHQLWPTLIHMLIWTIRREVEMACDYGRTTNINFPRSVIRIGNKAIDFKSSSTNEVDNNFSNFGRYVSNRIFN